MNKVGPKAQMDEPGCRPMTTAACFRGKPPGFLIALQPFILEIVTFLHPQLSTTFDQLFGGYLACHQLQSVNYGLSL